MSWPSQFDQSKQSALHSTMLQAETTGHCQQLHIQQLAPMRPQLNAGGLQLPGRRFAELMLELAWW